MSDYVKVAEVGDVAPGQVRVVHLGETRVALCHVDGAFYAIDDVCTHDGGPLGEGELDGDQIECPRHGARFDVRTGKALTFPAVYPVGTWPVKVEGTDVLVQGRD